MQKMICPSCGAPLPDDGYSAVVTCAYCATRVNIPRGAPPVAVPGRTVPPRPRSPLEIERDELMARIAQHEREWSFRINSAGSIGAADVILPLLGAAVPVVIMLTMLIWTQRTSTHLTDTREMMFGCVFWLCVPLIPVCAILVHRPLSRRRDARAMVVAGHRDEALAPLRARLQQIHQQLTGRQVVSEKQRRLEVLHMERAEVSRQIDVAYARVEDERTSSFHDLTFIPIVGCGLPFLLFLVSFWIMSSGGNENLFVALLLVAFLLPVPLILGSWLWRSLARKRRVVKLTAERDAAVPKLQKRLHEIENEIQRLVRT